MIIKGYYAHGILRSKQFNRAHRRFLGQLELISVHAAGTVNYQNQTKRWNLPLAFQLHRYGQQLLNRRLEIAAHSKAVFTANHYKSDTVGAHRLLNQLHLLATNLLTGHIIKEDTVISGILRQLKRQHPWGSDLIVDQAGFQRIFHIDARIRYSFHDQHLRAPRYSCKSIGDIIRRLLVSRGEHLGPIAVHPGLSSQALQRHTVLSALQHQLRTADLLIILIEPEFPFSGKSAPHGNLEAERLRLIQLVRHLQGLYRHILNRLALTRQHIQRDSTFP